jgi:restriction system protein
MAAITASDGFLRRKSPIRAALATSIRYRLTHQIELPVYLTDELISSFVDFAVIDSLKDETLPTLLVPSIIYPRSSTSEGQLIRAVRVPWSAIVNELVRDWRKAHEIPARKWEELIAAAFDEAGYDEVTLTPSSNDHGRDVIAVKNGVGSVRILSSVKAYAPGHQVSYDDVRALAGVLLGDPKASKGILQTTSTFPPNILKDPMLAPLMPYRLELMDGEALRRWLEELAMGKD